MGAVISGWGTALPRTEVTNAEMVADLDISEEWIEQRTGIFARRVAAPDETTVSLATAAGARALGRAEVEAADLDLIIVATFTPDYQIPAAAAMVQAALGAGRAGAYDLNAGCSGFLYALSQASAMIEAGHARRILICGADVLSRVTDYSDAKSCVLFGDGAAAVVVEASPSESRLGPFVLRSDGSEPHLLYIPAETGKMHMEGREVYRRAVEGMTQSILDIVAAGNARIEDIDLVVAHQANARILEAVAGRLGLPPAKVYSNIARYGNTSAASIPLALAEAADKGVLNDGDVVVLTAFGAGFVWGAGMLRWGAPVLGSERPALSGSARA